MYRIAVTNRHLCEGDFLARLEQLAENNDYQAILLREKDLTAVQYETLAREVLAICRKRKKRCILHSFPEVAMRLCHSQLHLPLSLWNSLEEGMQKELRREMREIGTSIHSMEQYGQAQVLGATYVVAGHIFVTDCKKGLEPRGLTFLQSICQAADVPVYGIGGINRQNEKQVIEVGAAGVCVMSGCMKG